MFDRTIVIPPMGDDIMTKIARKITGDPVLVDCIVHMADGNIGAMNVIKDMFDLSPSTSAIMEKPSGNLFLGILERFDIKGSMIWLLYKDVCGQDINKMLELISDGEEAPEALAALHYSGFKWPREQ